MHGLLDARAHGGGGLVVHGDGVHVDGRLAAEAGAQLHLDAVDHVVDDQDVLVGAHLGVQGDHALAGAVVVHDQVVDAHDLRVGEHGLGDLLDELGVGRLAQQRGEAVAGGGVAGVEDEPGDGQADPAVDVQVKGRAQPHAQHDRGGGDRVGQAVLGRGGHGRGADARGQRAVEAGHPQLHAHGAHEDAQRGQVHLGGRGVEHLVKGALEQLHADHEDRRGDEQAAEVLDAAVAEGVLVVGGALGHAKAHERDDRAARVGQVVERVGHHGDGGRHRAGQKLEREQQQVERDAHPARERAVAGAHARVLGALMVRHEAADEQIDEHGKVTSLCG